MSSLNDQEQSATRKRVAIIGAGPIGLEAAHAAASHGFDVTLYEAGRVAENVRNWGHVRLFTPFGMNSSNNGRAEVTKYFQESGAKRTLPEQTEFLTGEQYALRYLLPLTQSPLLAERLRERHQVLQISRHDCWKGEQIGQPQRSIRPFRLLLLYGNQELYAEADIVFDCTGTYPHHNWIGSGGLPAIGERQVLRSENYQLPDIANSDREKFLGKKVLVIGAGYSAATAIQHLAALSLENSDTEIYWLTRSKSDQPIERVENDALEARDQLASEVNRLALVSPSPVRWLPGTLVYRLQFDEEQRKFRADLESPGVSTSDSAARAHQSIEIDEIIANVGYTPDRELYQELQVHECYATSGPIKLAARLLGEMSSDCLQQSSAGFETLCNPEPNYFILGAKSYGRDSRFLIKIGLEQIETVMQNLTSKQTPLNTSAPCP